MLRASPGLHPILRCVSEELKLHISRAHFNRAVIWTSLPLVHLPGGDLVPAIPGCVCPKVKDMGPFFQLQGSIMSENISLIMDVKFAASLNMGKNLC